MILICDECGREVNARWLDNLGPSIFVEKYLCRECRRKKESVLVVSVRRLEPTGQEKITEGLKDMSESEQAKVLAALGNEDAIKILRLARNGFDGRTDTYKMLEIASAKRYYYRLEKLMQADLLIRTNGRYELTPLGVAFHDSILVGKTHTLKEEELEN